MAETAMKFGPEWLRALSHGNVSSPPTSPGPGKFRLAEFRYGREEMLGLYSKALQPPDDIFNLGPVFIEEASQPLAYIPMDPEEQRMWQRPINSDAVLRKASHGSVNGLGRGRGMSIERGRGRGRGVSVPNFYNRGLSYEDESDIRMSQRESGPPGLGGRGKSYDRSHSINDTRGWADRVPPGVDDGIPPSPSREQNRSTNTNNWRSRKEEDRWRGLGESTRNDKWASGRHTWRGKETEAEWEDGRSNNRRPAWDDPDKENARQTWEDPNLPEWVNDTSHNKEGSFDATGAFHAPGYPEDEKQGYHAKKETSEVRKEHAPESGQNLIKAQLHDDDPHTDPTQKNGSKDMMKHMRHPNNFEGNEEPSNVVVNGLPRQEQPPYTEANYLIENVQQPNPTYEPKMPSGEDDMKHMHFVATDLVTKLVEDDDLSREKERQVPMLSQPVQVPNHQFMPPQGPVPEEQWYYTDPQGEIQGPFTSAEMISWYKIGYFNSDLLLKRHCDDKFAQLGHLTKVFGRVPFMAGPAVPPLKVSELQKERERVAASNMQHAYQQQVRMRQQQILHQLQSIEGWNSFSPAQQNQLLMQQSLAMPPIVAPSLPPVMQNPVNSSVASMPSNVTSANLPANLNLPNPPTAPATAALPQGPDAIQTFLSQMRTGNPQTNISDMPMTSTNPATSLNGQGPLQKLLYHLKKNNSGSNISANHLATNGALGGIPQENTGLGILNQDPLDPIKSLMNQLKIQETVKNDPYQKEEFMLNNNKQQMEQQKLLELQAQEERHNHELRLQEERQKEEEKRKELEEKNQMLERQLAKIQLQKKQEEVQKKEEMLQQQRKEEEKARKLKQQQEEAKKKEEKKKKEAWQMEEQNKFDLTKEEMRQFDLEAKVVDEKKKKEQKKNRKEEKGKLVEEVKMPKEEERKKQPSKPIDIPPPSNAHEDYTKTRSSSAVWNAHVGVEAGASPSLAEIQKIQEMRDKKDREAETQKELKRMKENQRKQNEEKKQKEINMKWAGKASQGMKKGKSATILQPPIKSLLEIQQEEEKELQRQLEREQSERTNTIHHKMQLNQTGAWGTQSWANKASSSVPQGSSPKSWNTPLQTGWSAVAGNSIANTTEPQSGTGFWENPKATKAAPSPLKQNTPAVQSQQNQSAANNLKNKKKVKEEPAPPPAKKSSKDTNSNAEKFHQWNMQSVANLVNSNGMDLDIPTFVSFLGSVESPYEVGDYVRSYFGDAKAVKDYTKQYLEKRSKMRNRRGNDDGDDILAPAPAINPASNTEFQEVKTGKSKKKKNKQQKH